jgi:hypothetical protein
MNCVYINKPKTSLHSQTTENPEDIVRQKASRRFTWRKGRLQAKVPSFLSSRYCFAKYDLKTYTISQHSLSGEPSVKHLSTHPLQTSSPPRDSPKFSEHSFVRGCHLGNSALPQTSFLRLFRTKLPASQKICSLCLRLPSSGCFVRSCRHLRKSALSASELLETTCIRLHVHVFKIYRTKTNRHPKT